MEHDTQVQALRGWRRYANIFLDGFTNGLGWGIAVAIVVYVYTLRS